ncbi:GGDEF domain-containing protein [Falsihalocynthiibacter sp. BN13B15]|uniref:sensor domain-containing diguanylate cyclase n=1 Tax=Falsihalocynthiibacter sp. BN13B15 TaxID=3240871 RepID=UPI00350FEEC0
MTDLTSVELDDLPFGCIVSNNHRRIIFSNRYITDELGWPVEQVVGQASTTIMSPASRLFCESYVYPMLLESGECLEIQLTFLSKDGARLPVIANAKTRKDGTIIWGFFLAVNRDKLYHELVQARSTLEEQSIRLAEMATIDELTSLMNRRAFNLEIEHQFAACERSGDSLSLLILDIDDFKRINDTYGHSHGDNVLQALGLCLSKACRETETAARFGGEEFIFTLNGTDSEGAFSFAQRIHDQIANDANQLRSITVSIGIATRIGHFGPSYLDLLKQADAALYRAKALGKNRTVNGGNFPSSRLYSTGAEKGSC